MQRNTSIITLLYTLRHFDTQCTHTTVCVVYTQCILTVCVKKSALCCHLLAEKSQLNLSFQISRAPKYPISLVFHIQGSLLVVTGSHQCYPSATQQRASMV